MHVLYVPSDRIKKGWNNEHQAIVVSYHVKLVPVAMRDIK